MSCFLEIISAFVAKNIIHVKFIELWKRSNRCFQSLKIEKMMENPLKRNYFFKRLSVKGDFTTIPAPKRKG
jgi:hypothetical protein